MSSALETALLEYVGDVLVNDCGQPVPDRVLRYHGLLGLPADCCTANGALSVSWDRYFFSDRWPATAAFTASPCVGVPALSMILRYVVCWPVPDDPRNVTPDEYVEADVTAARLVEVAECVAGALVAIDCASPMDATPEFAALRALSGQNQLRFASAEPINPSGGCAGVLWRLAASPRQLPVGTMMFRSADDSVGAHD